MGARRGTVNDPPWVTNEYTKCNYVRHVTDSSTKAKGWTPAPNNRGTIDILWSSCLTIFLRSWTALCLNLPPQTWSITVVQILWFTLNTLGRAIQRLAITTLELTTLGFIVCTLGTYCLWAHKPLDVRSHIYLKPGITMANILEEHWRESPESVQEHFFHTPLDFVGRDDWPWTKYRDDWPWTKYFEYWMGILRKMHQRWLFCNCMRI
jgi:hypothetical protein